MRSDALATPHGHCVILETEEELPLLGVEQAIGDNLGPLRRRELAIGRAALREALGQHVAIPADDRGAPVLPAGWVGSISHKGSRAAALVAPVGSGFVGIDLEKALPPRVAIGRRILTERERASGREVTLFFAIKEAIYKAVDPIVRRYVKFTEVELELGDGTCEVRVVDVEQLPVAVEAWWQERDGMWLATARAKPR